MSAAHRDGVIALWGHACYFRSGANEGLYGACRGRIQGCHWISEQTLKRRQSQARLQVRAGRAISEGLQRLIDTPIDEVLDDPRNGVPGCVHHHDTLDLRNGQKLEPPPAPPFTVEEFARDYGLEHELEDPEAFAA